MLTFTSASLPWAISAPYRAGHQLTEAEAQALNMLRLDLIRKAFFKRIEREKEATGGRLTSAAVQCLAQVLAEMDRDYILGAKSTTRHHTTPLGIEIKELAWEKAQEQALPGQEIEELAAELASQLWLIEEAKGRLAARNAIGARTLEDLLG